MNLQYIKPTIINVVTLGCSKNLVDSERLMRQLQAVGYQIVHDENEAADIVLINTCGFIGDAKEESINMILSFVEAKKRGEIKFLYVFGCLSQRYKNDLEQEMPEVDTFFGVTDFDKIVEKLGGVLQLNLLTERTITTPSHYAYLKISEGCNWGCSYCAIPLIRGKHISVPIEKLVEEATLLAVKGVKELLVTAQDTTFYGIDLYSRRRLADLLNALSEIKGIEWIRLHYAYPTQFPDDVIVAMRDNPKICKYLDIPLQHVSDKVLENMRRGIDGAKTRKLINRLRAEIPSIAIRTTLIVGHPGENKAAFEELKNFVKEMRFERLGVFCYSEEEGTYGAQYLRDTISRKEKQARHDAVMALQSDISQELNEAKIGKTFRTIIDRVEGEYFVGRTEYDSPEVDNEVLIAAKENSLKIGAFYEVEIIAAEEYDLYGKVK